MARRIEVELIADSKQLERAFARSARSASTFQLALQRGGRQSGGFVRGITSSTGALSRFGGALALTSSGFFAGAGIGAAFVDTISKAADFQEQMNVLQVVTKATGSEMAALSERARELGNDITIPGASATDAAAAMLELAKGGLAVDKVMGAAKGTLQLAAAAGIDQAEAAKIQVSAINAFNLAGEDAAHVADVLAGAANAAQGEITDFAIAFAQVSSSAHAMGFTLDETATAITALAQAGVSGSDAGTSLRVMFQRLNPQTKVAANQFKALGVSAYDAQGNVKPLRQIIGQFSLALRDKTQKEKQHALQVLFGTDAQRAANIALLLGTKRFDALEKRVTASGQAAAVSNAKMKGFTGAMEALRNAIQTLQVNIGTALLPKFTEWIRKAAKWASDSENQKRIQEEVVGTVMDLAHAFEALVRALKDMRDILAPVVKALGGLENTIVVLLGLKVALTLARWRREFIRTGAAAETAGGATMLGGLLTKLRALARIGVLAVAIRFPGLVAAASTLASLPGLFAAAGVLASSGAAPNVPKIPKNDMLKQTLKGLAISGQIPPDVQREAAKAAGMQGEALGRLMANETFVKFLAEYARQAHLIGRVLHGIPRGALPEAFLHLRTDQQKMNAAIDEWNTELEKSKAKAQKAIENRNKWFDALLGRRLAAVSATSDIASKAGQIGELESIAAMITAQIAKVHDITRKLKLRDDLMNVQRQIRDLRQSIVAEFIDSLHLGLERAEVTSGLDDDLRAAQRITAALRDQVAAHHDNIDLQRQLFEAEKQETDIRQRRRDARQFRLLGRGPTGEELAPTADWLRRRLGQVKTAVAGTFLDTNKTQSLLKRITTLVTTQFKGMSDDVKNTVKDMLEDIRKQLDTDRFPLTRYRKASTKALVAGLGLSPEQAAVLRQRLAAVSPTGMVPSIGVGAFGQLVPATGGGDTYVLHNPSFNGVQDVASLANSLQKHADRTNSGTRRGRYGGRH